MTKCPLPLALLTSTLWLTTGCTSHGESSKDIEEDDGEVGAGGQRGGAGGMFANPAPGGQAGASDQPAMAGARAPGGEAGQQASGGAGGMATGGGNAAGAGPATGGAPAGGAAGSPRETLPPKFSTDFEAFPTGQAPGAPFSNPRGNIKIDETRAYSGKKALRAETSAGEVSITFPTRQLVGASKTLYTRFMVYVESMGGPEGHYDMVNHNGLFRGDGLNVNGFYAFGGFSNNRQKVQIYGQDTSGKGTADCAKSAALQVPAKAWTCVELKITDEGFFNYETFINGEAIPSFSFPWNLAGSGCVPEWNVTKGKWYVPDVLNTKFGWRHVFEQKETVRLWFDDIAFSNAPIGCPGKI